MSQQVGHIHFGRRQKNLQRTRIHDQIALHRTRTAKSSGGFQCQRVGHGLVRVVLVHVDGVGHRGREGVVAKIPKVVVAPATTGAIME